MRTFAFQNTVQDLQPCHQLVRVQAKRVDEPFRVRDRHEGHTEGQAGDYLVREEDGTLRVCAAATFDAEYRFDGSQAAPDQPATPDKSAELVAALEDLQAKHAALVDQLAATQKDRDGLLLRIEQLSKPAEATLLTGKRKGKA